jgi:hypothetical protein
VFHGDVCARTTRYNWQRPCFASTTCTTRCSLLLHQAPLSFYLDSVTRRSGSGSTTCPSQFLNNLYEQGGVTPTRSIVQHMQWNSKPNPTCVRDFASGTQGLGTRTNAPCLGAVGFNGYPFALRHLHKSRLLMMATQEWGGVVERGPSCQPVTSCTGQCMAALGCHLRCIPGRGRFVLQLTSDWHIAWPRLNEIDRD